MKGDKDMEMATTGPRSPLQVGWTAAVDLANAVMGATSLYGVTDAGKIVALDPATGQVRWATATTHLRNRLTVVGSTVYAYRKDEGLSIINDNGSTFAERLILGINPLTEAEPVSNTVVLGEFIFAALDQALLVFNHNGNFLGGTEVGSQGPYVLAPAGANRVVAVDRYGQPALYELGDSKLTRRWLTTFDDPGTGQAERPVVVAGNLVITGANGLVIAVNVNTGAIMWRSAPVSGRSFLVKGSVLYVAGPFAHLMALDLASGAALWRRMYLYETDSASKVALAYGDGHIYAGAWVPGGPIHLFAVREVDGAFAWQANPMRSGLPVNVGNRLVLVGTTQPAVALESVPNPQIGPGAIQWSPNPLRGARTGFAGTLNVTLAQRATITATVLRESEGLGEVILAKASRNAGTHTANWNAGAPSGFSDDNQFGRILVDVEESGGAKYTVAALVPVNTLPDLLGHWAKANVETMLYHRHIGGYPDLLFRPDNLVTRAETSAIIARTLGLSGPSAGFQTKFVDIAAHWARNAIMALEERAVINGFLESDGTYTFRPELNITRGQEARILVNAYGIAPAPGGFRTRFTDTAGHWARPDIEALEAAGFVNGFQEADGTFSYRPEQGLTRAELSTVVVRILHLSRP
ncbi:MAG: hypothetical protein K0R39_145 [Symbiobacteriaceae bacterium]|nr:hypothetical protein [Symbiobacteriaceae bacterium]